MLELVFTQRKMFRYHSLCPLTSGFGSNPIALILIPPPGIPLKSTPLSNRIRVLAGITRRCG
jgi:hypothetical protein